MASNMATANHGRMRTIRLIPMAAVLLTLVTIAGANAAPSTFQLVFDGHHNASLTHEGSFTSSLAACASGSAADVSVDSTTDTALRRFACSDGGEFTATVSPLPAEHGGNGIWQIVSGTRAYANLRGRGTFSSTRLGGRSDDPATITFRSTWQGVADFDTVPPAIDVTKVAIRKLKRPKGTYSLRVEVTFPGESAVSYVLQVVDPRKPLNALVYRVGRTTTGSIASAARIRPAKSTRTLAVKVAASDAVGNDATAAKTVRLR
jgi:hypothetical protein